MIVIVPKNLKNTIIKLLETIKNDFGSTVDPHNLFVLFRVLLYRRAYNSHNSHIYPIRHTLFDITKMLLL